MKFEQVTSLPDIRRSKKYLQTFIEEFEQSGIEIAQVLFNEKEYKNFKSCYSCLYRAVMASGFNIHVLLREDAVYLVRGPRPHAGGESK